MLMYPHHAKPFSLKIFRVNPYNSEILITTVLLLHCFDRPEGEGDTMSHVLCETWEFAHPPTKVCCDEGTAEKNASVGEGARATRAGTASAC